MPDARAPMRARRGRCASNLGSRWPPIIAAIVPRPETPKMSEATTDSLICASSSSFSTRFFSAVRSETRDARYRVRSRNRRIGGRGDEAGPDHLPLGDLAQPDGVQPVGLRPPGQVLDVPGVDQPHVEPVRLQQVERRPPVVRRGLHHHPGRPQVHQPVRHHLQRTGHRGIGADLLQPAPGPTPAGQADAADQLRPCRCPGRRPGR